MEQSPEYIIRQLQRKIEELKAENEELQYNLDGYVKCDCCNGDGGDYAGSTGRLGHSEDPQTWVDCGACGGEGWVEEEK